MQAGQRFDVEMVVMVMRDQHRIDRRQRLERDAGRVDPLGAEKRQRARTLGIDRVDQDVEPGNLVEERGVAEMHDPEAVEPGGRLVLRRRREMLRERLALALAHLPAQNVQQPLLHLTAIGKAQAVEILGDGTLVIRIAGAAIGRPGKAGAGEDCGDPEQGKQLATVHGLRGGRGSCSVKGHLSEAW